jgi:hypothetical protein
MRDGWAYKSVTFHCLKAMNTPTPLRRRRRSKPIPSSIVLYTQSDHSNTALFSLTPLARYLPKLPHPNANNPRGLYMPAWCIGLASTAITVILDVDVDWVGEIAAELFGFLLSESISCNDCRVQG